MLRLARLARLIRTLRFQIFCCSADFTCLEGSKVPKTMAHTSTTLGTRAITFWYFAGPGTWEKRLHSVPTTTDLKCTETKSEGKMLPEGPGTSSSSTYAKAQM